MSWRSDLVLAGSDPERLLPALQSLRDELQRRPSIVARPTLRRRLCEICRECQRWIYRPAPTSLASPYYGALIAFWSAISVLAGVFFFQFFKTDTEQGLREQLATGVSAAALAIALFLLFLIIRRRTLEEKSRQMWLFVQRELAAIADLAGGYDQELGLILRLDGPTMQRLIRESERGRLSS